MRIKINGKTLALFSGAKAGDAVRKFLFANGRGTKTGKIPPIKDGHGHPVAPDGELSEGDELTIDLKARPGTGNKG